MCRRAMRWRKQAGWTSVPPGKRERRDDRAARNRAAAVTRCVSPRQPGRAQESSGDSGRAGLPGTPEEGKGSLVVAMTTKEIEKGIARSHAANISSIRCNFKLY